MSARSRREVIGGPSAVALALSPPGRLRMLDLGPDMAFPRDPVRL